MFNLGAQRESEKLDCLFDNSCAWHAYNDYSLKSASTLGLEISDGDLLGNLEVKGLLSLDSQAYTRAGYELSAK